MIAMCTSWTVALGGGTALDTLGSASHGMKSNPDQLKFETGILLQRCLLILLTLNLPVMVVWCFIGPLLVALGQPVRLAMDVQCFLRILCFGAPGTRHGLSDGLHDSLTDILYPRWRTGYIAFESLKKYLQILDYPAASTLVLIITSPINALLNWYFIQKLGYTGAAWATSITYTLNFIFLCLFCKLKVSREYWGGFSWKAFQRWSPFLRLAIPGLALVGTEWWAFEIVALCAGLLGRTPLAAQSIIMTVDQVGVRLLYVYSFLRFLTQFTNTLTATVPR